LPVKDHSTSDYPRPASRANDHFGSGASKLKVFVDPTEDIKDVPQLVKKKKSRAALDSIKWALGDRTNVKDSVAKTEKNKEPRSSVDSDKEKWKWTIGRGRKDRKTKGRDCTLILTGAPDELSSSFNSSYSRFAIRKYASCPAGFFDLLCSRSEQGGLTSTLASNGGSYFHPSAYPANRYKVRFDCCSRNEIGALNGATRWLGSK
jgi:hypothetical protein